jgi:hypothetical protein
MMFQHGLLMASGRAGARALAAEAMARRAAAAPKRGPTVASGGDLESRRRRLDELELEVRFERFRDSHRSRMAALDREIDAHRPSRMTDADRRRCLAEHDREIAEYDEWQRTRGRWFADAYWPAVHSRWCAR